MTPEQRQELKTFAWSVPVILPLIEKRKHIAFSRLMMEFKQGNLNTTALVAELNVLNDLELELKQKQQEFRALEAKEMKNV
jgi:hypothetical protein